MNFTRYVALGDSMSIDLYPALDLGRADVAVALERTAEAGNVAPVGAASLLFRNDDEQWPEDAGADLASRFPGIAPSFLAQDGATIGDVFGEQLPQMQEDYEPTLVTLTLGGNDLFSAFANKPRPELLERITRDVGEAYEFLVDAVRRALPNAVLLLTTIYDPSDRSGKIRGILEDAGPLPLGALDAVNERIRKLAAGTPRAALADVYARFLGHGVSAAEKDQWYWKRAFMEPNARGASEIRHVWLDALDALQESLD